MEHIFSIFLLMAGFVLLIKGADYLIDGASSLAVRFNISEIVIGLTIVAFGTSAPELVVNMVAAIEGKVDLTFGNIIGSNIINILLILGVAGIIYPLQTEKNTIWHEIPFSLLAVIVLFILVNDIMFGYDQGVLTTGDGLILLLFFIIFLVYSFGIPKVESRDKAEVRNLSGVKIGIYVIGGLSGLIIGGQMAVNSAVNLATILGMSEKLVGLTIVAIGTSLPELFTSAMAAYKKKPDIAIGNIVGSNIFNIFLILSLTSIITPLPFDTALNPDIIFLIVISFILFFTMFTGKKRTLDRWESIMLLGLFIVYNIFIIIRG